LPPDRLAPEAQFRGEPLYVDAVADDHDVSGPDRIIAQDALFAGLRDGHDPAVRAPAQRPAVQLDLGAVLGADPDPDPVAPAPLRGAAPEEFGMSSASQTEDVLVVGPGEAVDDVELLAFQQSLGI